MKSLIKIIYNSREIYILYFGRKIDYIARGRIIKIKQINNFFIFRPIFENL